MDVEIKKSFRDLAVWQKSMKLAQLMYSVTNQFTEAGCAELIAELRKTGVSIPGSIADGFGRKSTIENLRCLHRALGAVHTLDTQIELAIRLEMVSTNVTKDALELCAEIEKMLVVLIEKLRERIKK